MEKLIERYSGKSTLIVDRFNDADGDIYVTALPPAMGYAVRGKAVDRLAAYEDTNLTPSDIADLRNELCLRCGQYKAAHIGACDGCRWKKGE
jgi:hypothetical protein